MASTKLSFRQTGFFSDLICDYWEGDPGLAPFYDLPPVWSSFGELIARREKDFAPDQRKRLVHALRRQYEGLPDADPVMRSLDRLERPGSFTVVTGHQLNLFTGPLYFLYKILACVNAAEELKRRHPTHQFVPVYWMATEDHDFEEINHFRLEGRVISWDHPSGGPVGRFDTDGLDRVAAALDMALNKGRRGEELLGLFKRVYLESPDLTQAHRRLVHELFGQYGLVCLDGDDAELKGMAAPVFERDLTEGISFRKVTEDSKALQALDGKYTTQANPREVNFFYLSEGKRRRIIRGTKGFELAEGSQIWTAESLRDELREFPDRFSPNVIMRPLYQEAVLPNLAYIGGGGELAYWLQLRGTFDAHGLSYPLLLLRPSLLLVSKKEALKAERLDIGLDRLFGDKQSLVDQRVRQISEIPLDFSPLKDTLADQFAYLYDLAAKTDSTFLRAVKAEETRQLRSLRKLEQRLLGAQRRKLDDEVQRVVRLRDGLFPGGSLQERSENFADYYQLMGKDFIPFLKGVLDPIPHAFRIEILPE